MPYLEELGLATALEMLAQEQGAEFMLVGDERRLDDAAELALFRITQEALRNSQQHAFADQKTVTLSFKNNGEMNGVTLIVEDNGHGFVLPDDPTAFAQKQHYGLLNIRERGEAIGAAVHIVSQLEHGTQISVVMSNPPT